MEPSVFNQAMDLFRRQNSGELLTSNKEDIIEVSNFLTEHGKELKEFDCYTFAVLLGFVDFGRDYFKKEKLYTL